MRQDNVWPIQGSQPTVYDIDRNDDRIVWTSGTKSELQTCRASAAGEHSLRSIVEALDHQLLRFLDAHVWLSVGIAKTIHGMPTCQAYKINGKLAPSPCGQQYTLSSHQACGSCKMHHLCLKLPAGCCWLQVQAITHMQAEKAARWECNGLQSHCSWTLFLSLIYLCDTCCKVDNAIHCCLQAHQSGSTHQSDSTAGKLSGVWTCRVILTTSAPSQTKGGSQTFWNANMKAHPRCSTR